MGAEQGNPHLLRKAPGAECIKALTLQDAMDSGRIKREKLGPEFFAGNSGDVPAYVEIEARIQLGAVPGSIRLSWLDRDSLDEFRIRLYGERGTAVLDPRKNKTAAVLYEADGREQGTARLIEGPPVPSTYERFAAAVAAYVAGHVLPGDGSLAEQGPDFAQGLAVQRAMDMLSCMLVPGGLPR